MLEFVKIGIDLKDKSVIGMNRTFGNVHIKGIRKMASFYKEAWNIIR